MFSVCVNSYLDIKIKEGDAHNIVCPAFDCNKLVPVEFIEKTVSTTMAQRYLQFDIKVSVIMVTPGMAEITLIIEKSIKFQLNFN